MANSLQGLPQGKWIHTSYYDIIHNNQKETDNRSGDEIIVDIVSGLGMKFKEE